MNARVTGCPPVAARFPVRHSNVLFADDPGCARGERFAYEAARRGLLFHPRLAWFVSAAHDDAAIDEARQ